MANDIYITEDFLLETALAQTLYHEHAKDLPIIDYHCHLPPADIAQDRRFRDMAEIWLEGDHYKWRAMRANGVAEKYCTGDASGWEKFQKWAETVPYLFRNQLYPWTHLELKQPFGISDRLLCPETAKEIWDECNAKLAEPSFSARGIMKQMNVVLVCTTDDPTDSLEHHQAIAGDKDFGVQVLPTWRPDKGMAAENPVLFKAWVERLEQVADHNCHDFGSYLEGLRKRQQFFHDRGCRLADHGIPHPHAEEYTHAEVNEIFIQLRAGNTVTPHQAAQFKSAMLYELGRMNHALGWTQQYHMGPLRNTNTRMARELGPDTGFDSMGDFPIAEPLARMLDRLEQDQALTRTILYNHNPKDNMVLATMAGNFQDGSIPGKIQFGSGWWYLDQKDGMEQQINDLSQVGLLSRFVGMLTDSRSFLSYPRHDYFRRILCNLLGNDMEKGLIPKDMEIAARMVRDVSYGNAARYFGFDLPSGEA